MTKAKKQHLEETQPGADEQSSAPDNSQYEQEYVQELERLRDELVRTRLQADEYLEGWQRARAEFANYKKRVEREQAQVYQTATGAVIKRFLGVLDDLERALKNCPRSGEGADWAEGIELVYRKLASILESEGVKLMQTDGQMFDPNLHEAILSEDSDQHESGQIIEALQQGYLLGDKVLRPARVRVAK
jgi:molecular chaperone GrpE